MLYTYITVPACSQVTIWSRDNRVLGLFHVKHDSLGVTTVTAATARQDQFCYDLVTFLTCDIGLVG